MRALKKREKRGELDAKDSHGERGGKGVAVERAAAAKSLSPGVSKPSTTRTKY